MNIKLLNGLDFATKISEAKAASSAGQDFLNNYKSYLFNNPSSCSLVNSFVSEAANYSYDAGLVKVLEAVNEYIRENRISWQLASACENIANNPSPYSYIAKTGIEQVQKLLEQNETNVVSYIKAGALKGVQYVPEFRNICKEVYKQQITEAHHVNYDITTPISYVLVDENSNQYFRIGHQDFCVTESTVSTINQVNDDRYNRINNMLESFVKDGDNIYFEYKSPRSQMIRYTFVDEGLKVNIGQFEKTFSNPTDYMEEMNIRSKIMPTMEKMQFMNICNNINTIFENIDNVVELDCAKLIKTNDGFVGAVVEGKDNVNLTIFHSAVTGSSSNNYNYMAEALKNVTKITGLDLSPMFEARIKKDCDKIPDKEQEDIKQSVKDAKDAQFSVRKHKIAKLAEAYKNDPVKIALLNQIAKDLNALEK